MSWVKRLLSPAYRRALQAEAVGEYATAARAYALAGERAKVAEMHLFLAEQAGGQQKVAELRLAVSFADAATEEGRAALRRVGQAMLRLVRRTGVISDSDRALLLEAAGWLREAGDPLGEGECHELAGDEEKAAEAFARAGEVDRLERLLARDEEQRQRRQSEEDGFGEYRLAMVAGERGRARAALRRLADPRGARVVEHGEALAALEARMPRPGRLVVKCGDRSVIHLGVLPFTVGRDPSCEVALRDHGVSRRHIQVVGGEGGLRLRDLGARNGTWLRGLRLAEGAELSLDGEGEILLGDSCRLRFAVVGGRLEAEVNRGLDRGLSLLASTTDHELLDGRIRLHFAGGLARLDPTEGRRLRLDGALVGAGVETLRGDRVEVDGEAGAIEVEG